MTALATGMEASAQADGFGRAEDANDGASLPDRSDWSQSFVGEASNDVDGVPEPVVLLSVELGVRDQGYDECTRCVPEVLPELDDRCEES